jgi:hypothetical protein
MVFRFVQGLRGRHKIVTAYSFMDHRSSVGRVDEHSRASVMTATKFSVAVRSRSGISAGGMMSHTNSHYSHDGAGDMRIMYRNFSSNEQAHRIRGRASLLE